MASIVEGPRIGPAERFFVRWPWSTLPHERKFQVIDRVTGRPFVSCTGAVGYYSEASALECARNLNRGRCAMTFNLRVATDNAAFADDPAVELARILRVVAERVEGWTPAADLPPCGGCYDANGNRVGSFEFIEEV